jgi:hypothetical protein
VGFEEKKPYCHNVVLYDFNNNDAIIQFNSIYLCAKLNSPEANYKVSKARKWEE